LVPTDSPRVFLRLFSLPPSPFPFPAKAGNQTVPHVPLDRLLFSWTRFSSGPSTSPSHFGPSLTLSFPPSRKSPALPAEEMASVHPAILVFFSSVSSSFPFYPLIFLPNLFSMMRSSPFPWTPLLFAMTLSSSLPLFLRFYRRLPIPGRRIRFRIRIPPRHPHCPSWLIFFPPSRPADELVYPTFFLSSGTFKSLFWALASTPPRCREAPTRRRFPALSSE